MCSSAIDCISLIDLISVLSSWYGMFNKVSMAPHNQERSHHVLMMLPLFTVNSPELAGLTSLPQGHRFQNLILVFDAFSACHIRLWYRRQTARICHVLPIEPQFFITLCGGNFTTPAPARYWRVRSLVSPRLLFKHALDDLEQNI